MPQRFNPPPNWPRAPEGWTPPPGWRPPASWGPAPPGWPFWIEVEPERRSHRARTAVFGLLCVAGVGAVGLVAATIGDDTDPVAAEQAQHNAGDPEPGNGSEAKPGAPDSTGDSSEDSNPPPQRPGRAFDSDRGRDSRPFTPYRYYADCELAEQAGAAPLRRGEPGYRSALDPDGDGIACDD